MPPLLILQLVFLMDLNDVFDAFSTGEEEMKVQNKHIRFGDSEEGDNEDSVLILDDSKSPRIDSVNRSCVDLTKDSDNDIIVDKEPDIACSSKAKDVLSGLEEFLMSDGDEECEQEISNTPRYITSFANSELGFEKNTNTSRKLDTPKSRPAMSCFNCEGEHSISECKEPRDHAKIRRNRAKIMGPRKPEDGSNRYHSDLSDKTPGVLSDELREALGLGSRDLPRYIYRMRSIGYPPGYLHKAMTKKENALAMFDDIAESESSSEIRQISIDQIVKYPGFNVPVPKGFYDEHLRMPHEASPMLPQHSIETFVTSINESYLAVTKKNNRKRNVHEVNGESSNKRPRHESVDMDLENANEIQVLPPPPPPPAPPPPPPPAPPSTPLDVQNDVMDPPRSPTPETFKELSSTTDIPLEGKICPSTPRLNVSFGSLLNSPGTALGVAIGGSKRCTPNLYNFAQGIVPFEPTEELPTTSASAGNKIALDTLLNQNEQYQKVKEAMKKKEEERKLL